MIRKLFSFKGGIHPPQHKAETRDQPIRQATLPKQLVLPLHQHIGESAEPCVKVGEHVLKGQLVAYAQGYVSAPVHASSSGTVIAIEDRHIPHPSGLEAPCIVIETDGQDQWFEHPEDIPYKKMGASHLRSQIRCAGIVGLGGAGFPAAIKLNPVGHTIDTLIINGVECEPHITCDDRLMRERAEQIISGIKIMRHALQADEVLVAIEDNKPEAIAAMQQAAHGENIEIVSVPTLYPQGGEKQLIKILTDKECPSDGLPFQIGIVVHNVGTAVAVHDAINLRRPLVSRIVTVTGDGIHSPANMEIPLGISIHELIEQCGGMRDDVDRIIIGGPMMGYAMHRTKIPVIKTSNCILAVTHDFVSAPADTMPCIRCGVCADVCPVQLLPQQLHWYAKSKEFDRAKEYNLFDCIECGCCDYVCPSHIPLVHYYRFAKTEIWALERDKEKAELAKLRHEHHQARLAREKAEKAARLAKKKAALAKKSADGDTKGKEKQAAIQDAMDRAKAKKDSQPNRVKNTRELTPAQQKQIDEADARRQSDSEKPAP